jgi:hypothetical protein
MLDPATMNELKHRLKTVERIVVGLATAVVLLVVAGAAGPLAKIVCDSLETKDGAGRTTTILHGNGDVEVGGKLLVQNTNILDTINNSSLKVAEITTSFPSPGLQPTHRIWAVTREAAAASVPVDGLNPAAFKYGLNQAAASAVPFGDEIVASWITPTAYLHQMTSSPDVHIARLETQVVERNRLVVVTSSVGTREIPHFTAKIIILYREKKQ